MTQQSTENFRAVKPSSMILSWWLCVITHFSKHIECPTLRVTPNVNCRLGVIMTSQCRFSDYNNDCTILLGVVDKGGGWAWRGA